MLARPKVTGEVIGTLLQAEHFHLSGLRAIFDQVVDAYYTDGATDALSIAVRVKDTLRADSAESAANYIRQLAEGANPVDAVAHARIVKREHDKRALLTLAQDVQAQVLEGGRPPEQLAAEVSQRAMQVATATLLSNEILSYADLGRRFMRRQQELRAARAAGIELGAFFGLKFVDDRVHGLKPGELLILGGEPGAGKSGVAFCATRLFAQRQLKKPEDKRIGAFILSLEMGEEPSSDRFGQSEGLVDGAKLRDGSTSDDELARIVRNWASRQDIPLYFNFTSMLRAAQLRALVVEAIRRYNVGLVVIDHMRYFDADRRFDNAHDEDEAKARFLKEEIAKDLNVAVILLAHTTKAIEMRNDKRPQLSDLRGGGMVAAHADFVTFMYRPYMHAEEDAILNGEVLITDAELLWRKNRHGLNDSTNFFFDPSVMHTRDQI